MQLVSFDLLDVRDEQDFYRQFAEKFALDGFGHNLDALWDVLTGEVPLPLRIVLRHLPQHPAEAGLQRIVTVMREAESETAGAFSVRTR
ncbi:barstar family protein [Erwinia sp. JUb26]|uniref:barstar family protein n=1 Tax=Erwinia sp. JUb26 TaxID=2485126 RepID=UPI000F48C3B2|nr:barstar family protein [Erwinia sp. JUb26]ROR15069.1 ribonuclease inhibitor [Erwinia sp. JUb26]